MGSHKSVWWPNSLSMWSCWSTLDSESSAYSVCAKNERLKIRKSLRTKCEETVLFFSLIESRDPLTPRPSPMEAVCAVKCAFYFFLSFILIIFWWISTVCPWLGDYPILSLSFFCIPFHYSVSGSNRVIQSLLISQLEIYIKKKNFAWPSFYFLRRAQTFRSRSGCLAVFSAKGCVAGNNKRTK